MRHHGSRRDMLVALGAGALSVPLMTPAFAQVAASGSRKSLASLAEAKGMRFGAAVGSGTDPGVLGKNPDARLRNGGITNPRVAKILIDECDLIVPENELKMYVIQPKPGVYNFAPGDRILAFCQAHDMAMRGHNLFWAKDQFTPKWLLHHDFGPKPKVAAEAMLRGYIGAVTDHYGEHLSSWDVVNEAIDEKTGQVRENVFTRILGEDALRICFEAARDHLPTMPLTYNDYMGWGPHDGAHRDGVIKLLRWFRERDVPIDMLGLQSHLSADTPGDTGDAAAWSAFLDTATGMGYDLLVTEFDVNDRKVAGDVAKRDAVVARTAKRYLDLTLSYPQVKALLCWGMDDRYSWLQSTTARDDGTPLRPTPYDADFQPKPLREAIAAAIMGAPQRQT